MKCDRRWWNDGRLDREIKEHSSASRSAPFSWAVLDRMTLRKLDEQIRTSIGPASRARRSRPVKNRKARRA